jgi:hypothetical protein
MIRNTLSLLFKIIFFTVFIGSYNVRAESAWPQFLHDARNTARSEYTIPNKVKVKWKSNFAQAGMSGLSISHDNETIYASSFDHYLYAIRSEDGLVLWKYLTNHSLVGSPAVDTNGNIFIGSQDDFLYCIKQDGILNWKVQLDSDVISSPVISPNDCVLIATQTRLYSYSFGGTPQWSYEISTHSTPAVSNEGMIYVAGQSDLYSLKADGSLNWTFDLSETGFSSPSIADDGTIYCAGGHMATNGHYSITAVNPDGTLKWTYQLEGMPYLSCPGISPDGTVFIGSADYHVYAINPDGTLKWKYLTSGAMDHSPFAIDSNGAVITVNSTCAGKLYAINVDGSEKWTIERGEINDTPCFQKTYFIGSDDIIYVGTDEGIIAFADESTVPTYNLAGNWSYQDTYVWDNCPDSHPAENGSVTIFQQFNEKTNLVIEENSLWGFIYGSVLNVSGSYPADSGTITQNIHVQLSSETEGIGSSTWTWSDGISSCEGESEFTFIKDSDTDSGDEDDSNGSDEDNVDQEDSDGSGGGGGGLCFISTLGK